MALFAVPHGKSTAETGIQLENTGFARFLAGKSGMHQPDNVLQSNHSATLRDYSRSIFVAAGLTAAASARTGTSAARTGTRAAAAATASAAFRAAFGQRLKDIGGNAVDAAQVQDSTTAW